MIGYEKSLDRPAYRPAPGQFVLLALLGALFILLAAVGCGPGESGVHDERRVELGRQVYQQNCAVCHGADGEGQLNWMVRGPDGRYPAPPHDSSGHTWHHSDGLLFRIVKYGGASLNIPNFESGMPAFGDSLSDEEIRAVIDYLKTFWGPEERELQEKFSERDPFPDEADGP